jgi:DegV family protein with EDD domain
MLLGEFPSPSFEEDEMKEPKVAVVIDSTTNLPKGMLKGLTLRSVPVLIIWGKDQLRDGVDIQPNEFYERLEEDSEMPSTSQASPSTFKTIYEELLAKGHEVLTVTCSSKLSGMYNSALKAKEMLKDARVEVIDSLSGTMPIGLSLAKILDSVKKGASLQTCRQEMEKALSQTGALLTVDTLDFLHRGGRIGGAKKFLGSLLNLKPIIELSDGGFAGLEQVRTRGKALTRLVDLTAERIGDRKSVYIAAMHANAKETAEELAVMISNKIKHAKTMVAEVSPGVGVHMGPGTVGLAYLATDD